MAWTKTLADCDAYFVPNNHLKAYSYRQYDADVKEAAFNQAVRELKVSQGRELQDPTTDDQVYRDDFGVFEQTIYLLDNTARQLEDGRTSVIDLTSQDEKQETNRVGVLISPEALRFFAVNRLVMRRG